MISMLNKETRVIVALIMGIFLSIVISCSYTMLEIANVIKQNGNGTVTLIKLITWINAYGIMWSGIALGIAIGIYKTISDKVMIVGKHGRLLLIISVIFGFLNVGGLCLYYMDALPLAKSWSWFCFSTLLSFGWAILFYVVAVWILWTLENKLFKEYVVTLPQKNDKVSSILSFFDQHIFITAFVVIIIGWLPWIVFFYPASMENDVYWMLASYFEHIPKTNHHPWFATSVLAFFYNIGVYVGNTNLGFFLFVIVRDLIMALIYANCIELLKKSGVRKTVYIGIMFFYAFTPVWGAYAKHGFKDTFAAALFCLYITTFVLLIKKIETDTSTWGDYVAYGLAGVMASFWRNNVIYCVVPATALLVAYLLMKKIKTQRILIVLVCLSLYFGYNAYIYNVVGVHRSERKESMSVFVQQTARTVRDHDDELTDQDKNAIDAYLGYKGLAKRYKPIFADPVKGGIHGSTKKYLKSWFKLGLRFPLTYIEAAYCMSYGYVAFTPRQPAGSNNGNSGMSLFHGIGSAMFPKLVHESFIDEWKNKRQLLIQWANLWERIPVANLTNTIAAYTWMAVLLVFYLLVRKRFNRLIPFVPMFLMILTCMASPVNDCFRYFAGFAAALPVTLSLLPEPADV